MKKAEYEACWAGGFVYVCEKHIQQLRAIASAMGLPLEFKVHHGTEECKNCKNEKEKK